MSDSGFRILNNDDKRDFVRSEARMDWVCCCEQRNTCAFPVIEKLPVSHWLTILSSLFRVHALTNIFGQSWDFYTLSHGNQNVVGCSSWSCATYRTHTFLSFYLYVTLILSAQTEQLSADLVDPDGI